MLLPVLPVRQPRLLAVLQLKQARRPVQQPSKLVRRPCSQAYWQPKPLALPAAMQL